MSSIEASLRLEIGQYQENLARAKGEAAKLKDDLAKKTLGIEEAVLGKTQKYHAIIDRVRAEAKALKAELSQAQNQALGRETFNAANAPLGQFRRHMQNEGREAGQGLMKGMRSSINANGALVVGGLTAVVGTATMGLRSGFDFNMITDNAEVGISNVLRRFDGLNMAAAKNEAAKALERIIELEPITAGGLDDLTMGFMKTLAASKGVGMSTMQNVELTAKFANAVANAGLQMDQLTQEYRSILTGTITKDSQIAKILGITNEDVNEVKRAGGSMFDFLNTKLGEFGEAGDGAQVAFSSAMSAIKTSLGALSGGAFDETVASARELSGFLKSHKEDFEAAGLAAGDYLYTFKSGLREIMGMLAESETLGNVGRLIGKTYTPTNPEDIALAREGDEANRRQGKIQAATNAVNEQGISPEEKATRQAELNRLMRMEMDIYKESRRLQDEERVSEAESLKRAREMVELRQKSRIKAESEDSAKSEDQTKQEADDKARVLKLQAELNRQAIEALPPLERRKALMKEMEAIYDKMQSQTLYKTRDEAGIQATAEGRLKHGNVEDAEIAFNWLKRVRELKEQIAAADMEDIDQAQRQGEALVSQTEREKSIREKVADDAKKAADEAARSQDKKDTQTTALEDYKAEMAIIDAQIAGQKEKAEAMQRALDIARETREIQERTGVSESEAKTLATKHVDQQQQLEKNPSKEAEKSRYDSDGRREDGRKRIRSNISGNADDARTRAEGRGQATKEKRDSKYKENFGGISEEDARLKKKFSEQFGPKSDPLNGPSKPNDPAANPLAVQADKNAAKEGAGSTSSDPSTQNAQQVIALMTQMLAAIS